MFSKRVSLLVLLVMVLGFAAFASHQVRADAATTAVDASALKGTGESFGAGPTGGLVWDYGPTTGSQGGCWANTTASQNFAEDVTFATTTNVTTMVIYTCIAPTAGDVHLKVRADDGAGNPSNTLLYDADVVPTSWVADPVTGGYAVTADLPGGFSATGGTTYWFGMSGNGYELGQYSVLTPDDGMMAQFSGPTFSFHTGVGDQMFQLYGGGGGCGPAATNVALNPALSLSVTTGNTNLYWLVRLYFANGTSQTAVQTGLPSCFSNTFNTNYVPTNPPVTSICSFLYDPALPGVVAQSCAPVP
jgi:hypothetical protein